MKTASAFHIALVTAPDRKTARRLAQCALQARLVACANLIAGVESHYWWRGRLESGAEVLVIFKTAGRHLRRLEELVLANHPYDTPEFIVLPLAGGNGRYLDWLARSVRKSPSR
jgi:periplasmic divalent cation tolerance protein